MNTPEDPLPKPPFVERRKRQPARIGGLDARGLFNSIGLVLYLAAMTVALVGGGRLIWGVFIDGVAEILKKPDMLVAKSVVLGLAYIFGWLVATITIRAAGSLILPIVVRIYMIICLIAICGLYVKILFKLYGQAYEFRNYIAYIVIMACSLAVLVGLHLILDEHDLRPFSIPLLVISLFQLIAIVVRYIFTSDVKPIYLCGDLFFFIGMISTSSLMLAHKGFLNPLRNIISASFDDRRGRRPQRAYASRSDPDDEGDEQ